MLTSNILWSFDVKIDCNISFMAIFIGNIILFIFIISSVLLDVHRKLILPTTILLRCSPLESNTKLHRSFILTLWNAEKGSIASSLEKTLSWNVFGYVVGILLCLIFNVSISKSPDGVTIRDKCFQIKQVFRSVKAACCLLRHFLKEEIDLTQS